MAPPAAPKMEPTPDAEDSFSSYLAEGAHDLPSSRDLFDRRHAWSYHVRNELGRELEIEREHRSNYYEQKSRNVQYRGGLEHEHQEPKAVYGKRRKREDDNEEEEAAAERFSKRRNVNTNPETRSSQPLPTSHQSHAPSQTARSVHPHKFALTDNGPWYQTIYNEVYNKVYSEIYDEAYSKAYNLAYNDAFKDGYDDGGADGCHDGNSTGYMHGYYRAYKKSYRVSYDEAHEMGMDQRSSECDYEDESGDSTFIDEEEESTVSDEEEESESFENEEEGKRLGKGIGDRSHSAFLLTCPGNRMIMTIVKIIPESISL